MKSRLTVLSSLIALALVIFAGSGWAWWHYIQSEPTKVFERMLETSMSTPSVTKTVTQKENDQKLEQIIQLSASPAAQVHSRNVLDQGQAVITTESIGNKANDFIRYENIQTDQKNSAGSSFDFSSVLSVWGKSGQDAETSGEAQLFNQTILGVVPMANLAATERHKLLDQIMKDGVYQVDYSKVRRAIKNGRPVYTYDVSVQPVAYITMLKSFAGALGLPQLEDVDPQQYANTPPLSFSFEIDVWSAQLAKVDYTDTGRSETYTAYGARTLIAEPENVVTLEELQSRLQSIQ